MYNHEAETLLEALNLSKGDMEAANKVADGMLASLRGMQKKSQYIELLEDLIASNSFSSKIKALIIFCIVDAMQPKEQTNESIETEEVKEKVTNLELYGEPYTIDPETGELKDKGGLL